MVVLQPTPELLNFFIPMEWDRGPEQSGLLSLLYMPHFGHSIEVNTFVQQLMVSFHGGFLCLDEVYYMHVKLIVAITGLPLSGID